MPSPIEYHELAEEHHRDMANVGKFDPVTKPMHYHQFESTPLDVIKDWKLCYLLGQVLKYIGRYRFKGNPIQDLKKARWYLDEKIKELEEAPK